VRRPEGPVLSRFWEIPQTGLDADHAPDLAGTLARHHGLNVTVGRLLAVVRHAITFRRIRVEVYDADLVGAVPRDAERVRWATPAELLTLPLSSMTHKILAAARLPQLPLALR